jgi:CheY-like chemotaxis protein
MTAAQVTALFTPFARFHKGSEGVGLGLVVTKILAELNSGVIEVHSEEGKGTVVSLIFPLCEEQRDGMSAAPADAASYKVLLVDDERECSLSLKRVLERAGHVVEMAASVAEAQRLYSSFGPEVVISDHHLPDGKGAQLLGACKGVRPTVRCALLTGEEEFNSVSGGMPVFKKPVDVPELLRWIGGLSSSEQKVKAA